MKQLFWPWHNGLNTISSLGLIPSNARNVKARLDFPAWRNPHPRSAIWEARGSSRIDVLPARPRGALCVQTRSPRYYKRKRGDVVGCISLRLQTDREVSSPSYSTLCSKPGAFALATYGIAKTMSGANTGRRHYGIGCTSTPGQCHLSATCAYPTNGLARRKSASRYFTTKVGARSKPSACKSSRSPPAFQRSSITGLSDPMAYQT
jgi:hypothetical protein